MKNALFPFCFILILLIPALGIAQSPAKWNVNRNTVSAVSGKLYAYRIVGTLGDCLIRFGDSTVIINYNRGRILINHVPQYLVSDNLHSEQVRAPLQSAIELSAERRR